MHFPVDALRIIPEYDSHFISGYNEDARLPLYEASLGMTAFY
jgi:hypothetical protein